MTIKPHQYMEIRGDILPRNPYLVLEEDPIRKQSILQIKPNVQQIWSIQV